MGEKNKVVSYYPRLEKLLYLRIDVDVYSTLRTIRRIIYLIGREPMGTRIPLNTEDSDAKGMAEKLEMSTAEIGLSVRTTNCLEERGIFTVNDLLNCTREDLLAISNFGEKTLEEVYKALEGIGFQRRYKREAACVSGNPT
jgi:DNA-directed RNA polymerase subunit alpha